LKRPAGRPSIPDGRLVALPCSSGALEGKNCKIKYLKRLMYGRANFNLLQKIALLD
jgi:transposase